jgi:hypothetical protein
MQNFQRYIPHFLICTALLGRVLPHPPNFSPLTAVALFAGAFIRPRLAALFIPISVLLMSDLYIGFSWDSVAVYFSFFCILVFSMKGLKIPSTKNACFSSVLASTFFFIVTNFWVWMDGRLYSRTWDGLIACYTMAIPFFGNSLISDVVFTALLFGCYNFVVNLKLVPSVQR